MNKSQMGFVDNIEELTESNTNFRQVIYTAPHSQLVLMSLQPGEEIGVETHAENDQFIRIEAGRGTVVMNGEELAVEEDSAIVIPAGVEHNLLNSGTEAMKLYTIYSPAHHPHGTVHATKAEAQAAE